jgi:hypothetical protein
MQRTLSAMSDVTVSSDGDDYEFDDVARSETAPLL